MKKRHAAICISLVCLFMMVISYFFWDISLANYCRNLNPAVKKTAEIITAFGVSTWYIVASIILYLLFRFIRKDSLNEARSLFMALSLCVTGLFINILKLIAGRYRPVELFNHGNFGFEYFRIGYEWASFPSGHAQTAFSLATALTILKPRWGIPLFIAATAVGISRIILTSHYLSDVIAGAGIGVAFTMAIKYWFDLKKIKLKKE